jgi:hypothetical protein
MEREHHIVIDADVQPVVHPPQIALIEDKSASTIVKHLKSMFARHGIPEKVVSDNVPFGSKEMHTFADSWNFSIITSSPNYQQSNGQAERTVQTVKRLLQKALESNNDAYIGLLQYRNAPITGLNVSPAQLLFSRSLRTKLPVLSESLQPKLTGDRDELRERQLKQKYYYDRNTRHLPNLQTGDVVRIKHNAKWVRGTVTGLHTSPRSFLVKTDSGTILRRNRRHLIKTSEQAYLPSMGEEIEDEGAVHRNFSTPQSTAVEETSPKQTTRSGRVVRQPARFKDFVGK